MKNPALVLPKECFRRLDSSLQLQEVSLSHSPVKMATGLWLLSSPTCGYPAPVNSAHKRAGNKKYPSVLINGHVFTWVGLEQHNKCLVSYLPTVPDSGIEPFTNEELVMVQDALNKECIEIRQNNPDLDFTRVSTWRGFRQAAGDEKNVEARDYVTIEELSLLVFGPTFNLDYKNNQRRKRFLRELSNSLGFVYSRKSPDRYHINAATISTLRTHARQQYAAYA